MFKKLFFFALLGAGLGQRWPARSAAEAARHALARPATDSLKIVFFGSSVPFGQGATGKYGYASRYARLLSQRATAGQGAPWTTANISIPGDNTLKVLARWERDLPPQQGRYVVYALALGNEGIHGGGQAKFEQFRDNMQVLMAKARAAGLVPVVTNSYTRNDYNAEDYAYIRQMNLLLHAWAVPTVNLLGAVDDGQGHWAAGYFDDALHPNDRGHAELTHAWVPSLFDALRAGKPLLHFRASAGVRLAPKATLRLVPEALVHPFTQVFGFRATGRGQLLSLQDSTAMGSLHIEKGGALAYASAGGGHLRSAARVSDNHWHQVVLTHYFARGETLLYLDGKEIGRLPERLHLRQLTLGGAARGARYRNWLFYRAGMNAAEVRALAADSLLKSSLELYAPLDGRRTAPDSLSNLAQSMNRLVAKP
ncbi:MAG TPA: GDSL-type esterase/lipase family protein [Hymenobacter sp.]|uniref:GDSL-type esterase/lipase family protein n=1 Tax=Hymenobacter sp. TaxID=1898978 RepID=UPI002D7FDBF8|nr:GDSL-type esterase/lipase family protein [Hymenobacter sp.]HET9503178.1 GDSL-type esterase/lipase family protein [Hymenobacter sp.]